MRYEHVQSDVTVVGGGLSGVSAAVAAARLGQKVALIQNRPVLGGNSSSEMRVWVVGATGHGVNRYARETGILGEMFVENQYTNPEGNPYYWDLIVLEKVRHEPNIQLFLNTDVHEVEAEGDELNRHIKSVTGWMMGSERKIRFESPVFLDCTGDGLIGFLAGAKYQIGREAKHEYNEAWAPDVSDNITLGSTLLFYTKDAGRPVKFVPPSFTKDITQTPIPIKRVLNSGDSGCHYWWIEWGGEEEIDTLHDNERIRDELWSVIYGIWDYIKNSGKFEADTMTLEWVGSMPGKREYRRFKGDYVLNQNDLERQTQFEDNITYGGWSIDLHPPEGMYAADYTSRHYHADGIYQIPYRSLYSVNVDNLLFAGRSISATQIAFGSSRVMGTCASVGQAAGTAAALCVDNKATPREIYEKHLKQLQQTLLWEDASIIGIKNDDPADLAPQAEVMASSHISRLAVESADESFELATDVAFLLPVDPGIESIQILLDTADDTIVEVEVWDTGRPENYIPHQLQVRDVQAVGRGSKQWITFNLPWNPENAQNAFVVIKENPSVSVYLSHQPMSGVLSFIKEKALNVARGMESLNQDQLVVKWNMKRVVRKPFCFRLVNETKAFEPGKIIDGYQRPYGGAHMWLSAHVKDGAWIALKWDKEVTFNEIHITFNDDVNEDLINLHHHRTEFDIIPELVRDYRLEVLEKDSWKVLFEVKGNRQRKRKHVLENGVQAKQLRLVVEQTNGTSYAEVVEIRVR
ncbi:FAD-dependent oxidoreductase [Paenibacillus oenotherae]|uniref:FAD-dependent oxidoreductase n=1 Tax=Paenibacillus oenotherae TaxID=1435645 RepID=A0ABS7D6S6_9BACL|nr:FAD-dependent oxidoreductase [Paenibacillus oenotherae]MBW7475539.1 FAD-dependent oxidoreductase [Paenibacillus oenotherae]